MVHHCLLPCNNSYLSFIYPSRSAMTQAMIHSRPPSYHSQVSDQNQVIQPVAAAAQPQQQQQPHPDQPNLSQNQIPSQNATLPQQPALISVHHARNRSNSSQTPSQTSQIRTSQSGQDHHHQHHHHHVLNVTVPNSSEFIADMSINSSSPKSDSGSKKSSPKKKSSVVDIDHSSRNHPLIQNPSKKNAGSSSSSSGSGRSNKKKMMMKDQQRSPHLVTIVQTSSSSAATRPVGVVSGTSSVVSSSVLDSASSSCASTTGLDESVIVTVSGSIDQGIHHQRLRTGEVEILAHL